MSQPVWTEHFKEQLQGLTSAYEQSQSSLSLLGYALQEKILSSDEYIQWALTHFKLPRLQSRFFTETPISQEMFAKWATHYRWSEECLPVAEWDGALIVACLQPPQDFPTNPAFVLVLADFENLKKTWHELKSPQSVAAPSVAVSAPLLEKTIVPASAPAAMSAETAFSADSLVIEGFTPSDDTPTELESSSEDLEPLQLETPEVLEGLFETSTVVQLQPTTETSPILAPLETPPGEPAAESAAETQILELTPSPEIPVAQEKKEIPPPPVNPPRDEVISAPVFEDSFTNKAIPIIPRPAGTGKAILNPLPQGQFLLEKLKKKNASLLSQNIQNALNEMKVHFDKALVLTLDEDESQMTVFAWDETFKEIKNTAAKFPLKTPSIFNIAVSTQKPFHGYISLNEVNEKFFDEWNKGVIPDHVTISPILWQDKVVGLLMGIADKTAYNKVSLALAEKLSTSIINGVAA